MKTIRTSVLPKYHCKTHGILYDFFPCPWPDCANGISESEFEVPSLMPDGKSEIYNRHEWQSSRRVKYYTWQRKDFPDWFSCKKVLWSEARRRKLFTASPTKTVYHYTSIESFMGILSSGSIWLTDYSYLNDRKEIKHGSDIVCNTAKVIRKNAKNENIRELLNSWIDNLQNIDERVCIASFSADGDSLSQWRSYGNIAIGFDVVKISQHISQSPVFPVEYNDKAQHALAHLYLTHMCQSFLEDTSRNLLERTPNIYHETNQLIELIAIFKDSSFQDEHEHRSVYIENSNLIERFELKKPKKYFRSTNGHIIPYVVSSELYPLPGRETPLGITEIVLGPNSDEMLERGVRELLQEHGVNDISIRRSRVPYRT